MKKTYIAPEVELTTILTEDMIAGSLPLDGTTEIENSNDILSRDLESELLF